MSEFRAGVLLGMTLVGLTWATVALNDGTGWAAVGYVGLGLTWLGAFGLWIGPKDGHE